MKSTSSLTPASTSSTVLTSAVRNLLTSTPGQLGNSDHLDYDFDMMTIDEFCKAHPDLCFDFSKLIREQPRIYDPSLLKLYPEELQPTGRHPEGAGRSRANPNQTKCHFQCATCQRVRRNDFFYTPPSQRRNNLVHTHCKDCTSIINAKHYTVRAEDVAARREDVLRYIAPHCLLCGFDDDTAAMDMHHIKRTEDVSAEPEEAKELISGLVTAVTFTPSTYNCEKLLREASRCVPLCCRCHRMVHSGKRSAAGLQPLKYSLPELLRLLKRT